MSSTRSIKRSELEPGTWLCDMHDGFRYLPTVLDRAGLEQTEERNFEVEDTVKMTTELGDKIIEQLVREQQVKHHCEPEHPYRYTNKILVLVDPYRADGTFTAAYSYDGNNLTFVRLKLI